MRMRSIKPEFWSDRKLAQGVSRDARLLYISLWNHADEWARCIGDLRWVKGHCFPYDDDLTVDGIDRLLNELARMGRLVRYDVEGDPYLYLVKLSEHQRLEPIKTPSRLPEQPDPENFSDKSGKFSETVTERSQQGQSGMNSQVEDFSEKIPEQSELFANHSEQIVVQHVAGSREHVAGSRVENPGTPTAPATPRGHRLPATFEVTDDMRSWALVKVPGLNLERATEKFINHWHAASGKSAVKSDWKAAWRNWMLGDFERMPQNALTRGSTSDARVNGAYEAGARLLATRPKAINQ